MEWFSGSTETELIILGNPPFVGMDKMSADQQVDRNSVFESLGLGSQDRVGRLDYVASWFGKAIPLAKNNSARVAFVTTNSLFQGDQARAMETVLSRSSISIDFAHRTFKWASQGKGKAAVYCSIVGFSKSPGRQDKSIFYYPDPNENPFQKKASVISSYLIDCALPGPKKLANPLNPEVPGLTKGSQPTDGGFLIIEQEAMDEISKDPICQKYLRPFMRAEAILNGGSSWCLWLEGASPAEMRKSPIIQDRLKHVALHRSKSPTPSVQKYAELPFLFTQIRQPKSDWLALPRVSSENRSYIPMAYLSPDVIASDTVSLVENAQPWLFAVLQSKAFTDWVAIFSGALEGRFRISPGLSFNGFPLLAVPQNLRSKLDDFGKGILEVRSRYPSQTLADLYHELGMPKDLREIHQKLDALLDDYLKLKSPSREDRAKRLLETHHELLRAGALPTPD
jgi:hypothetical protein